jgi:gas vesicle protein
MSKSNKESVVKGLLDCQLEITENQDIYKKNVNYINEVIPDFVEETRNLIEEHNASPDCKERKVILENLATVLNHWADEIERAIPLISDSLTNSVRAVEDILKIKSLSNEDKYFWVDDLNSFLPSCKENYEALKSHRQKIESQADMLESQILAKLRLLSVYDALLVVYDVSINKIREILLLGKTNL